MGTKNHTPARTMLTMRVKVNEPTNATAATGTGRYRKCQQKESALEAMHTRDEKPLVVGCSHAILSHYPHHVQEDRCIALQTTATEAIAGRASRVTHSRTRRP